MPQTPFELMQFVEDALAKLYVTNLRYITLKNELKLIEDNRRALIYGLLEAGVSHSEIAKSAEISRQRVKQYDYQRRANSTG